MGGMKTFLGALMRAFFVGIVPTLVLLVVERAFYHGVGADIGGGVMTLATMTLGSLVWAVIDGRRRGPAAVVLWLLVAAWVVPLDAARAVVGAGGYDTEAWSLALVTGVLIAVPGSLGAVLGAARARGR